MDLGFRVEVINLQLEANLRDQGIVELPQVTTVNLQH
jgi:hypothetical protein